jgi:hypothetical protein
MSTNPEEGTQTCAAPVTLIEIVNKRNVEIRRTFIFLTSYITIIVIYEYRFIPSSLTLLRHPSLDKL